MKATIFPSRLKGVVSAPPSKSSMQRALAAALVSKGTTVITNPGNSNDDKAALSIIRSMGAVVEQGGTDLVIESKGIVPMETTVDCGESGLAIRMFAPLLALSDQAITIHGSGSLLQRPMQFFDDVFPLLGVSIQSNNGLLPLRIHGPLKPATIEVDGSMSSQFLTGLLMAYAAADARDVSIHVKNLKSKPYIDLTLDVMKQFGLPVPVNENYTRFYFPPEPPSPQAKKRNYTVEGDWSGGAFLLVAGAIAGPLMVNGLDPGSAQADRAIIDALMAAQAGIAFEAKGIRIHPSPLEAFYFDATDCPDLFPPLTVLAAYCNGTTRIKGVHRLVHKESDRAIALQDEFDSMGVDISIEDDLLIIKGNGNVKGADVSSHHDHRIAMACAVAALGASGEMVIEHAEAVAKSYPAFFEQLKSLGADVSLSNKINWHE